MTPSGSAQWTRKLPPSLERNTTSVGSANNRANLPAPEQLLLTDHSIMISDDRGASPAMPGREHRSYVGRYRAATHILGTRMGVLPC